MAIYDILCEVKDVREADTGICEFNGFLEDYLSIIETAEGKEDDYTILSQLFEKDHNLKICANLAEHQQGCDCQSDYTLQGFI